MNYLAILFLAARFYAHRAHNTCKGESFFADHDFLGGLYETYDDAYDAVVERMIGLGEEADILQITQKACNVFSKSVKTTESKGMFKQLLELEKAFCNEIKTLSPKSSDGTQNLLQGLADQSEMRQYKIQQRLK